MKIAFTIDGVSVGYMEYDMLNRQDSLGILGLVQTKPAQLGALLTHKIKTNAYKIVVSGGSMPSNLSMYWDGVIGTLNKVKSEIKGFDYFVPSGQDPLKDAKAPSDKIN